MRLCIDSGNSRIKWGLHDGKRWLASSAISQAERSSLGTLKLPASPDAILISNVAGEAALVDITQACKPFAAPSKVVRSSADSSGVRNGYENPTRLGVDRWCALIGARHLGPGPALVVMAGTATTIDSLDANGTFLGGLILPGLAAMHHALHHGTADLPVAKGAHADWPRNTDDAITSGCLEATLGAIERAFQRLSAVDRARCLISGGNAGQLLPLLGFSAEAVDNLVLEGLAVIEIS